MNEITLVSEAVDRLRQILAKVPNLHVLLSPMHVVMGRMELDALLEVRTGGKSISLIVEVKSNAQLRDARRGIDHLEKITSEYTGKAYGILVSQYLPPSVKEFCIEKNIGYLDFSGNCRLAFADIYIEREVPFEKVEKKRLKSLFSLKSSHVIRRLLTFPNQQWKVQTLAEISGVSPATVSMIKDKLLAEEYAARHGETFVLVQPERLLQSWASHYHTHRHKQIECYRTGNLEEIEKEFANFCDSQKFEYAFTMFSGARRVASFTRGIQRGYVYVDWNHDILELALAAGLKPVDSGGNFRLLTPADNDVLFEKQLINGEFVVSDIQLYLDLAGHKGRGEENAEYLLEHRIRQKWH